jgi:hypothetical protein
MVSKLCVIAGWDKSVTLTSAVVSVICFFIGVVISYLYATPTGASVVIINIVAFGLFWLIGAIKNKGGRFFGMGNKLKKGASGAAMLMLCLALFTGCAEQAKGNIGGNQNQPSSNSAQQPTNGQQGNNNAAEAKPYTDRSDEVVEIKEKMFVAQSNDVYYNADEYLGKTIKYEGLFSVYTDPTTNNTYYSVIRYGPGCCGVDANCGFEVAWTDGKEHELPTANDWVEVSGVLVEYSEDGYDYLRLNLATLNVLETRGAEYVTQ